MTTYNTAPGPSRALRNTLPPMMMMAPSAYQRPYDYTDDLLQASYLRRSYAGSAENGYNYEFARSIDYHPSDTFPLRHGPNHPVEIQAGHNNTEASPSLSLSLLLAAANAAQADTNSYVHFPPTLSPGCSMDPSGAYSRCVTSSEPPASWPALGLATSDSDRLAPTPPQTPLNTPEGIYKPSMLACCRLHSDGPHPHESKWRMERIGSEPAYVHKPSLPALLCIDYSDSAIILNHSNELPSSLVSGEQKNSIILQHFHHEVNSQINVRSKRMGKRKRVPPEISKHDSQVKREPNLDSEDFPKAEKPKQGRKKRSVGYVRPIILHRKRVGQRLLDMLRTAPIPSKAPSMELNRARCFPFADMKNKLKLWYGLQIEWPSDAPFGVDELRSTRRMRIDELERLDKTLDGGQVRLRLSDEVLAEEPHRETEFSLPSDGDTGAENSCQHSEDQRRKRRQ